MLWPFEYQRPETPEQVDSLLASHPDATIFAGGTNLVIDMELNLLRPTLVVDIKQVGRCNELTQSSADGCFFGAALSVNKMLDCSIETWQCLREAIAMMATYQVRNRATAVGNLCNASPAADLAPPLMVIGTTVLCRHANGKRREVPLSQFFTGVKETVLEAGEWVEGLRCENPSPRGKSAFFKKQRVRGHDLAIINVAGSCCPDRKRLKLAVGACGPTPLYFDFDSLYRQHGEQGALTKAVLKEVLETIAPIDDVRASAAYRRDMVEYYTKKLLVEIHC